MNGPTKKDFCSDSRKSFLVTISSEHVTVGKSSYKEYLAEEKKKIKALDCDRMARLAKARETIEQLRRNREGCEIDYDFA